MKGKNKCKILKEIRQRIADENDIPYVTRECTYQGECRGTCPKCEAELRCLERELEKRRSLGKAVAVAAVAAGLSFSLTACIPGGSGGEQLGGETVPAYTLPSPTGSETALEGEIALLPTDTDNQIVLGEMDTIPAQTEAPELLGDVAYIPGTPEDLPAEEVPSESFATPEDLPAAPGN